VTARRPRHWIAASALILVVVLGGAFATATLVGSRDPAAAAVWRPLLLSRPAVSLIDELPEFGAAAPAAELDELAATSAMRTTDQAAAVERWSAKPAPVGWSEVFLETVRKLRLNPLRTARALALLNVAVYDATIATWQVKVQVRRPEPSVSGAGISPMGVADPISSYPSVDAAIAEAAATTLTALYPVDADKYRALAEEAIDARLWSGRNTRSDVEAGRVLGRAVGALAVERAHSDGADETVRLAPPDFAGAWRPIPPAVLPPIEAGAMIWRPWLLSSPSELRPGPPPTYGSPDWQAEADEVVRVTEQLTPEQLEIARAWNDGVGTDTPPGHWIRIASELIERHDADASRSARILAYLSMAEADAFISCWDAKMAYWSGRPAQLIPDFASTIPTPNFPSYTSGHSSVSGAAATVLGAFFAADRERLSAMAEEAAMSRLYGGIHFRADNEVGLTVGRRIGDLAVARAMEDRSP
jgi:hypothetical protein